MFSNLVDAQQVPFKDSTNAADGLVVAAAVDQADYVHVYVSGEQLSGLGVYVDVFVHAVYGADWEYNGDGILCVDQAELDRGLFINQAELDREGRVGGNGEGGCGQIDQWSQEERFNDVIFGM